MLSHLSNLLHSNLFATNLNYYYPSFTLEGFSTRGGGGELARSGLDPEIECKSLHSVACPHVLAEFMQSILCVHRLYTFSSGSFNIYVRITALHKVLKKSSVQYTYIDLFRTEHLRSDHFHAISFFCCLLAFAMAIEMHDESICVALLQFPRHTP